ncbi:MAG: hypothetical protein OHK0039_29120 [Bacteroidia bacterium]
MYQGEEEQVPLDDANLGFMRPVMQVYLEDNNRKLVVFDELAGKIDLLLHIINARFLYKRLEIDADKGFIFRSTLQPKEIPLAALSSGEQHELVLFYQLLFKIKPG